MSDKFALDQEDVESFEFRESEEAGRVAKKSAVRSGVIAATKQFSGDFPFESMSECIDRMSAEDVSDPGAFCAAWYHDTHGVWPSENKD